MADTPALPPLTPAELDALAQAATQPDAIASAQRAFRRQAPGPRKSLLDAKDADTEQP